MAVEDHLHISSIKLWLKDIGILNSKYGANARTTWSLHWLITITFLSCHTIKTLFDEQNYTFKTADNKIL